MGIPAMPTPGGPSMPGPAPVATGVDALMQPASFGRPRGAPTRATNRYVDPFDGGAFKGTSPAPGGAPPPRTQPPQFAVFNPGSGGGGGEDSTTQPPSY